MGRRVLRDLVQMNYVFTPGVFSDPYATVHMNGRRDAILMIMGFMFDRTPELEEIQQLRDPIHGG